MTKDEFKKHARTRQFQEQTMYYKFNTVWLRLTPRDRRDLIEITRINSLQQIKESDEIQNIIYKTFSEAREITIDIEIIVSQIKSFDDGTPIDLIG